MEELLADLPPGAYVAADKAYLSAPLAARILAAPGVRLVATRRKNMAPNTPADEIFIRDHRWRIQTLNSQLETMGTAPNAYTPAPSMTF